MRVARSLVADDCGVAGEPAEVAKFTAAGWEDSFMFSNLHGSVQHAHSAFLIEDLPGVAVVGVVIEI